VDVDHLNGGEFFDPTVWRETWRQAVQAKTDGDVLVAGEEGEEGEENVGVDASLLLMIDRPEWRGHLLRS
jgi:hypothetical protein